MHAGNDNSESAQQLCGVCKAFYGNASTNYMCSKCFREQNNSNRNAAASVATSQPATPVQAVPAQPEVASPTPVEAVATPLSQPPVQLPAAAAENMEEVKAEQPPAQETEPKIKTQTDLNKCWECSKKVGLVKVACKCGYVYCAKHRMPELHNCSFDYVKQHQERLMKSNPQVEHQKMEKMF